jgi:hypothetical protein
VTSEENEILKQFMIYVQDTMPRLFMIFVQDEFLRLFLIRGPGEILKLFMISVLARHETVYDL